MSLVFILIFGLFIIGWLSYYTSASVYKSLKKNDNNNARLIQVLVGLGMFAILVTLIVFFIISNIHMER